MFLLFIFIIRILILSFFLFLIIFVYNSLIHSVQKNLSDHKDKLDATTVSEIEKSLEEAKAIDSTSSLEDIKAKSSALSTASMKIGEAMYKKTGATPEEGQKAEGSSNETEAEYTEKK